MVFLCVHGVKITGDCLLVKITGDCSLVKITGNCSLVKITAVWETTARQLAKGEWTFRVASNIHFILAGLANNSCKASRNLKTLAMITGLQL